jgi:hypothetical protein
MLIELLGLSTENSTEVDPTEVFSFALILSRAIGLLSASSGLRSATAGAA